MNITALGMIETFGLVSAIEAADAGLKAADVRLLGTDYVRGGLVMVRFEGEVAAVKAAVDAGADAAQRVGKVLCSHVIPRAMPEVFCMLASDVSVGPGRLASGGCSACGGCEGGRREARAEEAIRKTGEQKAEGAVRAPAADGVPAPNRPDLDPEAIKSLKVVELRRIARKLPGFSMSSGEIRFANKQSLLDAIAAWQGKEV